MRQSAWLAAVVSVFLVACGNGELPSQGKRVPGTISYYDEPIQITVPDSVARGETFTVSVMTFVGGCLEPGNTETEINELEATIRPYDIDTTRPRYPCTADIAFHPHTAELRFDASGEAQIRFVGLREGLEHPEGIEMTQTRTVVVR